jgi:aryl-alcohol dehydrogenase-like predicted oxidoreductase
MTKRALGSTGLEISPLVFGGNVFGWTADKETSFALLDAFVDAGFNTIDTADVYSAWVPGHAGGESETIIGEWQKSRGRRKDILILTKVGMEMGDGRKGLAKQRIIEACEESLKRLQTDVIDLYQSHKDDETVPFEETLSAYAELIQQGKVRTIGASNYSAERLDDAIQTALDNDLPVYQTLQPNYNLADRTELEGEVENVCLKHGLGVITYFSLAAGFLTGKYRSEADFSKSPRGTRMDKYLTESGLRVLAALEDVAARHNATLAQTALAWLLAKPAVTAPIVSATSMAQLQDILKAPEVKLSEEDVKQLDEAGAEG